ncbi:MAG: substrate-binding domain-containing protein [Proteobacteria bacterium]|nr:substrate-binding domain-containing protein [Pseudomonadota bacterium]
MRELAEHLLGLGRRRIAFLGEIAPSSPEMRERYRGYRTALAAAGLEPEPRLQVGAVSTEASGYEAMQAGGPGHQAGRPTAGADLGSSHRGRARGVGDTAAAAHRARVLRAASLLRCNMRRRPDGEIMPQSRPRRGKYRCLIPTCSSLPYGRVPEHSGARTGKRYPRKPALKSRIGLSAGCSRAR